MGKAFIQESTLTDIADAIRSKNGSSDTYLPSEMADAISAIPIAIEEKEVNFYDWEGTLLYSYTKAEALALTELPSLPDRTAENLTCEEWNWTLSNIKQALNDGYYTVAVGCTYHTTDDITYFYVNPTELNNIIRIVLKSELANETFIDWGDGNIDYATSTSVTSFYHTYSSEYYDKDVVIKVQSTSGTYVFQSYFFGYSNANNSTNRIITAKLSKKARLETSTGTYVGFVSSTFLKYISLSKYNYYGSGVYTSLFSSCVSLVHVNIPSTFVFNVTRLFQNCYSLKTATIPQILDTGSDVFYSCYSLRYANPRMANNISDTTNMYYACYNAEFPIYINATNISDRTFYSMATIKTITLSSNTSTINYRAFQSCFILEEIYLKATTPPTLSAAFTAPNSFYRIYVPRTSLSTYQSASNWSDIANNIYPYDYE